MNKTPNPPRKKVSPKLKKAEIVLLNGNDLHNYIQKNAVTRGQSLRWKDWWEHNKGKKRADLREKSFHNAPWKALIFEVSTEIRIERSLKGAHLQPAMVDLRLDFLNLLIRLRNRLYLFMATAAMPPGRYARINDIPHSGAHWPDWIPQHIKDAFNEAYDDIPYRTVNTHRKPLFRVRERSYEKERMRRVRILEVIDTEAKTASAQLERLSNGTWGLTPALRQAGIEHYTLLKRAASHAAGVLHNRSLESPAPFTWRGLLPLDVKRQLAEYEAPAGEHSDGRGSRKPVT